MEESRRRPQFEIVPDEPPVNNQSKNDGRSMELVMLALKSLSQRAIIAIENLFLFASVCLVFWAALAILNDPTPNQLGGLGIFAVFVLVANWIVVKRRG